MSTSAKLLVVLVFASVLRAVITLMLSGPEASSDEQHYYRMANSMLFYLVLFATSAHVLRLNIDRLKAVIGPMQNWRGICVGVGGAAVFFMFDHGEQAVEILAVSHFDPALAHQRWDFRGTDPIAPSLLSGRIWMYALASVVIGPAVEEYFFRGLLFRSLAQDCGFYGGVVLSSAIFVLMHYAQPAYLTTFAFSIALCYLYATTKSLILCWLFHAVNNLLIYLQQYYFDVMWNKSVRDIADLYIWMPQLIMLVISLTLVALGIVLFSCKLRHAEIGPIP